MRITFKYTVVMQAFTVLTFLEFANGQTTCNQGMGRVMYERLPNQQLQGFDDDVVRDTAPPFRVLEKCQDLCLRDRSANGLVRTCSSFDFQPGGRIAAFSGTPEYEESTCYLTREQALPEGIGNLMLVPNSVHFTEVCLTSNRPERECPSRRYVFERHPRKKLKLPSADLKETMASNRTECEDKCLNEFSFVCRSASYDQSLRTCSLSRFTRRTHPELLEDEPNSDYLENTCLNSERRCDGLAIFIKEENKRLGGPFEADIYSNLTLDECQAMCLRAEKYFCRSVEYDETTKQCIISEEDSVSQKDDITVSSSLTHHFYDLVCLDNPRGTEYPDNSITSHLFSTGRRADTAFQRYRNSRLGGEYHSEITGRALGECLDECLRQASFACRSAAYSDRHRTCRLSRYSQRDGMRIVYDADYDYYENLMHHMLGPETDQGGGTPSGRPEGPNHGGQSGWGRPQGGGNDRYPPDYDRYPDDERYGNRIPGDRYPDRSPERYPDRYPERYPPTGERYPVGGGRYPYDRNPSHERYPADRYPSTYGDRYPYDRYPAPDRYAPPEDNYIDRYPPKRYPGRGDSKYRPDPYPERYPDNYPNEIDRYPDRGRYPARYPPSGADRDRYPVDRYPPRKDRYPSSYDRYPSREGHYPVYVPGDRFGGYDRDRDGYPGYDRDRDRYGDRRPGYPPVERPGYPPVERPVYPPVERPGYPPVERPGYGGVERPGYPPVERPGYERPGYGGVERPGIGGGYIPERPYPVGGVPGGVSYRRPGGYRGTATGGGGYEPGYRPGGYEAGGPEGYPPGLGASRPLRCDDDSFRQIGSRQRMRKQFVRRFTSAQSLGQCERECVEARDFICRSFNFRDNAVPYGDGARDNCELSDRDTRDMDPTDPAHFDSTGNFDFYERSQSQGLDECLDVSQVCNEDGMEFTLRTPEGFFGRIYTYGFYDRCFFRGNGGSTNVLRISGAQGYPECGTQRYGDTMTNIVVVQFSDNVQTGRDKRFNLTCLFRGPGEAVVTSNYIGAGSGSPIPIEYLPAENSLSSKVRLLILYQNRPTTTIAVGDPLTFRLEAQDGYNYATDIFATNVVARDPYSGRSVQLIDRYGCPVDNYVFPELDKGREGDSLEARFNAFKIPESNFLVFEATVRTCRDGCQPAYCNGNAGRSEPSFGRRRRRSINGTMELLPNNKTSVTIVNSTIDSDEESDEEAEAVSEERHEQPEHVREMIEVFESRDELLLQDTKTARRAPIVQTSVCLTAGEYHGFLTAIVTLTCLLMTVVVLSVYGYRRYWWVMRKNMSVDRNAPSMSPPSRPTVGATQSRLGLFGPGILQKHFTTSGLSRMPEFGSRSPLGVADLQQGCIVPTAGNGFDDPSEPIYTDPSLFERSRSLRSLDMRGGAHGNNDRSAI